MSYADWQVDRLKKLEALKRENHIGVEAARKEERTGPAAARREEWARRPAWRVPRAKAK